MVYKKEGCFLNCVYYKDFVFKWSKYFLLFCIRNRNKRIEMVKEFKVIRDVLQIRGKMRINICYQGWVEIEMSYDGWLDLKVRK